MMPGSAISFRRASSGVESGEGDSSDTGGGDLRVTAYLQPIVSVRQREVRLVEALARGVDGNGRIVPPRELFAEASRLGFRTEFEQETRRAGFRAYHQVRRDGFEPILSLNADASLVRAGTSGAERLLAEVTGASIDPTGVAVEILESAFHDTGELERFARTLRRHGFLVALDDVGTGHSNLERIPRLEPDILKIDRTLVHGMHESFHRREVVRALVALAHQIGAVVIAEGIELEEDALSALSFGCDLFQGFYFGIPRDVEDGEPLVDEARLRAIGHKLRDAARLRLSDRRSDQKKNDLALRAVVASLQGHRETDFEAVLQGALAQHPFIEALYVLDENGKQLTHTVHREGGNTGRKALFQPSPRGADQSLKHYFVMLDAGLEQFTSDPYISSASGNYCITMSRFFDGILHLRQYVLCCDILVSEGRAAV